MDGSVLRVFFLILSLVAVPLCLRAQLEGVVVDSATGDPLPYCSIAIKGTATGTITNLEGRFRIEADPASDTLLFSFVGYKGIAVPAGKMQREGRVALTQLRYELGEVRVYNDDAWLYDMLYRASQELQREGEQRAKVLFELNTEVDGTLVEMVQAYYNGVFDGPVVTDLRLKNGRIGIRPVEGRYFVNLNTTHAFALLDIRGADPNFPTSPFAYNRKKLGRNMDLSLSGIVQDDVRIFRIAFAPREGVTGTFSGEIWMDSTAHRIDRITLNCSNCTPHPFVPLFQGPRILDVALRISLVFAHDQGGNALDHTELEYALLYDLGEGQERSVHTEAILRPFDRGKPFFQPLFDYPEGQPDYRQITFLPYDPVFWSMNQGLARTGDQTASMEFFARNGLLIGHDRASLIKGKSGFFEDNYLVWSDSSRIRWRVFPPAPGTSTSTLAQDATIPRLSRMDIKAQLYLDAHDGPTGMITRSATILDVFNSMYHLPLEPWTDAFLNIWFDLCEIQRRRMDAELQAEPLTEDMVLRIHDKAVADMVAMTTRYEKETGLGKDQVALAKWNALVLQELGIDNMALFPVVLE